MLDPTAQRLLTEFAAETAGHLVEDITTLRVTKFGPVNASGKLANSVEIEENEKGFRIFINNYAYFLIYGRKPGSVPPKGVLLEWLAERGIPVEKEDAVRFSIGRKGTTVYQENRGAASDLFKQTLSEDNLGGFTEKLADYYTNTIVSDILKGF